MKVGACRDWFMVGGLLVCAIVVVLGKDQLASVDARLGQALANATTPPNERKPDMDTLTTTVTNQSGTAITVNTDRNVADNETDAAQMARHLQRVKIAKESTDPE